MIPTTKQRTRSPAALPQNFHAAKIPSSPFIRRSPLFLICGLIAALLLAAQPSKLFALTPVTEVVVKTGDKAPDGDGVFSTFNLSSSSSGTAPALNNCGSAAFGGALNNATLGRGYGLFLGNGTTRSQVARTSDHAPGGASSDNFRSFNTPAVTPSVNDAGQLLFISEVVTNNGSSDSLFRSGPFSRLLNWGQTALGGNGMVFIAGDSAAGGSNGVPSFNQKGVAAFVATLTGTNVTDRNNSAIYRTGTPGSLTQIVREGQNVPEAATTPGKFGQMIVSRLNHPVMNESGQVAFRNDLTNTSGGFHDNQGLYRGSGSTLTKIARAGDALPGGGTIASFGAVSAPDMNDSGEVVFPVSVSGSTVDDAIFKGAGGTPIKIARQGDTIPNNSDTFAAFEGYARINNAGQVAFNAQVNHTDSSGSSQYWALFRGDGNATKLIVKEGRKTPVRKGIFSDLKGTTFCLNDSGQIAFTAGLDVDLTNNVPIEEQGIYFFDGSQLLQVARQNDPFLGSTITALKLAATTPASNGTGVAPAERSGLNDAGQVAFGFILADGREGMAIWSPTLQLLCAASRKTQGTAGKFDIDLPLSGKLGVECRTGGTVPCPIGDTRGNYTLVLTFTNKLKTGTATVTSGGSVSSTTINGNTMTVNLTGVANAQKLVVTLSNVTDDKNRALSDPKSVPVGILVGDVNGDKTVNSTDVGLVQAQVGAAAKLSNFRKDVDASGTITQADVSITQCQMGTSIP
jgi:hypothetical protein